MTRTTTARPRWGRRAATVLAALAGLALAVPGAAGARPSGAEDTEHPYAGMFLGNFQPDDPELEPGCAGALVSSDVFVTAAHCLADRANRLNTQIYVTFDQRFLGLENRRHEVDWVAWDPAFGTGLGDAHELAVLKLRAPVAGVELASLPSSGLLDRIGRRGMEFDYVGYGGDPAVGRPDGTKWAILVGFQSLTRSALHVTTQSQLGYGGACGHSGGPYLARGRHVDTVVALFFYMDARCEAHSRGYRLDTPQARAFLGQYVALPE